MVFLLDSDKQSFRADNVPNLLKSRLPLLKYNVLKMKVILGTLNRNMSKLIHRKSPGITQT